MTSKNITGNCPHDKCSVKFVEASIKEVGEHFNEHLSQNYPPEIVGKMAITLMNYRRERAYNG